MAGRPGRSAALRGLLPRVYRSYRQEGLALDGVQALQSRASLPLMLTTGAIMFVGLWLPSSPLAPALNLTHLPALYWPLLSLTLLAHMVLTQMVKAWLYRRRWI